MIRNKEYSHFNIDRVMVKHGTSIYSAIKCHKLPAASRMGWHRRDRWSLSPFEMHVDDAKMRRKKGKIHLHSIAAAIQCDGMHSIPSRTAHS